MGTLRLATRGSPLALRQTELVSELLRQAHPGLEVEPVVVRTQGDRDASAPLDQIGGQGVFVTEVEAAVADGRADAAVHSAKDMPSVMPAHFVLGAVPPRADPRDGLVGCHPGRPAGRRPGGDRLGPAPGPAGRAAPGPRLHRPAGQHGPAGGRGRGGEVSAVVVAVAAMERLGWMRPGDRRARPDGRAAPGGAGRHRRAVPGRRRGHQGAAGRHRPRAEPPGAAVPSAPCWPRSAGAAPCRSAPSPSRPTSGEAGSAGRALRVSGLLASGDGHTVIRLTRQGDDPEAVGAAVARALLDGGGAAIEGFERPGWTPTP